MFDLPLIGKDFGTLLGDSLKFDWAQRVQKVIKAYGETSIWKALKGQLSELTK